MRKTAIMFMLALASAVAVSAQTAFDAYNFSENDYEGTARSVAMGNAFTALGGDLGAVSINPAGSAVAKYSQFSFTPDLTMSFNTAQGVPFDGKELTYFQRRMKSGVTSMGMPNVAMTINWDTQRTTGLRNMSFGFIANKVKGWNENIYANGNNTTTSFMGAMAAGAAGLSADALGAENAYDYNPWRDVVGYQSGMISPYATENGGDLFIGASESLYSNGIAIPGRLSQTYGRNVTGGKFEYLFNVSANFSDFIYIGANLGVISISYDYNEYFKEAAEDPSDFENVFVDSNGDELKAYFKNMRFDYSYMASGSGYFGKIGILVTPGAGLRFGAAIQTPTVTDIYEQWSYAGQTGFTDSKFNASARSPLGEYSYTVISPFRANFGFAYTLGNLALISADYEYTDYSYMRFQENRYDRDLIEQLNGEIKSMYGASHMLRAGLEVKPIRQFAVRAGYNLATAPQKEDMYGNALPVTCRHNASVGLGYDSNGSFFADLACRYRFTTKEKFMPYADYILDDDDNIVTPAPEIMNEHSLWKVYLTLGWRF